MNICRTARVLGTVYMLFLGCGFAMASPNALMPQVGGGLSTSAPTSNVLPPTGFTSTSSSSKPAAIPLSIGTTWLATGITGTAYSSSVKAAGGTAPYHWVLKSGNLPSGLSLDSSTGVISGTPTASGTSNFAIKVSDSSSPVQSVSASFSLPVTATPGVTVSPVVIVSPAPPASQVGIAYLTLLKASGGVAGYTWSIASGSLPSGLSLTPSTGVISGVPTTSGTWSFSLKVSDSSSPALSASAAYSMQITSSPATTTTTTNTVSALVINSTSMTGGKVGSGYSSTLLASGGMTAYNWSISAGNLPSGLSLAATTGVISGTPTTVGTSNFTAQVTDSNSPAATASVTLSIVVSGGLAITSSALPAATVSTSYTASLGASGGTQAYTWSIPSGTLPVGLTLAATTGVISGTPTTSGTYSFTVSVSDSSSPAQVQTVNTAITVSAQTQVASNGGTIWYVRPDGGTRYSSIQTQGQCNGKSDAAYPGTGVNQACAFNDARYLWQDGSYADGTFPSWGWVISGGDTAIIRGSIGTGVTYRVGWKNQNTSLDSGQYFGLQGDPYSSGIPVPPAGTAAQHTRILGENYGACHTQTDRTQLHGGHGVLSVINLTGTKYVDLACLDITDFSGCTKVGNGCNNAIGTLDDYATQGILLSNTSTNITLTDMRIHGLGGNGISGAPGTGFVATYIDILGNASSGWNADPGDGTTGTGTALMQHFTIAWNGCAEEYPLVDAVPYDKCYDDSDGGYGDGFGTASVNSISPWNVTFDQGQVYYNTQDGLDALHLLGTGSSITITRVNSYGNMGQQLKAGGQAATMENNMMTGNCRAMASPIPGAPSTFNAHLADFCRAADTAVLLTVGNGTTTHYNFNTLYSAGATAVNLGCDTTNGACGSTALIDFRNNILVGFPGVPVNGYPNGTNTGPGSVYNGTGINPFTNPGSLYSNNVTIGQKTTGTFACPQLNETNAICGNPGLVDETYHLNGFGNYAPLTSSPVLGAGVSVSNVSTDLSGTTRKLPPTIGAFEQ